MTLRNKGYESIQQYVEDYIESHLQSLVPLGLELFATPSTVDNLLAITTSSGSCVTIVRQDEPNVVQVYAHRSTYHRIKTFCNKVKITEGFGRQYLVPCRVMDDDRLAITFKKVQPLNIFGGEVNINMIDIEQLDEEISSALQYLRDNEMSHGDPTLDNIGIDEEGRYVLYDYDKSTMEIDDDMSKFHRSLRFYSP